MVVVSGCPDAKVLEQLALGRLSPEEVERLADHCERCARCVEALQRPRAEDTLIEAMRSQGTVPDTALPKSVQQLMEGLKRRGAPSRTLGAAGTAAELSHAEQQSDPGSPSEPVRRKAEPTQELYDFLAPAQGPGELGWLGAYRVLKVLGEGGMGVVFLAEDPALNRRVALKAMKPALAASATARRRFLREAQAMAVVQHDHIVHINQIGQECGIPFLAMPFLEGETLEERLQREGCLPPTEVVRIGREVGEGLAAAHERGLIHRDIKPANLWLEGQRGRVKILDFGLARAVGQETGLTQAGAIAGTPAYMSPEQAQGGAVDGRCDLFSLGCVLYRAATGAAPFQGRTALEIMRALEAHQPRAPREVKAAVPPLLSELIMRLLAKNPGERPASAGEVVEALQAKALQDEACACRPISAPSLRTQGATKPAVLQAKAGTGRTRRLNLVAGGLAAAMLLFGGIIFFARTPTATVLINVDVDLGDKTLSFVLDRKGIDVKDLAKPIELTVGDHELIVFRAKDIVKQMRFAVRGGANPGIAYEEVAQAPPPLPSPEEQVKQLKPEVPEPKTDVPPPAADPDRTAAEWFHGLGSAMRLRSGGRDFNVNKLGTLPKEPFKILVFFCDSDRPLTDQAMRERLTGLSDVEGFDTGAQIDGTGFLCFKDNPKPIGLELFKAPITDEGLKAIGQIPRLESLFTDSRHISNDGLAHLGKHAEMRRLGLHCPFVTDVGFAHLKGLINIGDLNLDGTQVGDSSLAWLIEWRRLDRLTLRHTKVTDEGMTHVARIATLRDLDVSNTAVGDAGLERLRQAKSLQILRVQHTRVTEAGVKKFQEARPECKVER